MTTLCICKNVLVEMSIHMFLKGNRKKVVCPTFILAFSAQVIPEVYIIFCFCDFITLTVHNSKVK